MNNQDLADRPCEPCRGGIPPLEGEKLHEFYRMLSQEWKLVNDHHLEREFSFPDFKSALAFTNAVGDLAERVNHHPDIYLCWGKVTVTIWTHKINGLSEADFVFAAKTERIYNEK